MMYSTPIQTAAFRSAVMPGFAVAAAVVRFVFMLMPPIVGQAEQASSMWLRSDPAPSGPAGAWAPDPRGPVDVRYSGRGDRITTAVSRDRRSA